MSNESIELEAKIKQNMSSEIDRIVNSLETMQTAWERTKAAPLVIDDTFQKLVTSSRTLGSNINTLSKTQNESMQSMVKSSKTFAATAVETTEKAKKSLQDLSFAEVKQRLEEIQRSKGRLTSTEQLIQKEKELADVSKKSSSILSSDLFKVAGGFALAQIGISSVTQAFNTLKSVVVGNVAAYDRQFQAQAQLRNSLGFTSIALQEQAKAIQTSTRFGDEAVMEAQAMMAQFIREEDLLQKLTPVVVDFAAAKKKGLSEAADLVTKSISSTTSMLGRYGITLKEQVGTTARVEEAITKLNAAFGGQAKAIADGGTGPLVKFSNAMLDISETFGEVLTPTINQMVDLLSRSLLPVLMNATDLVDRLLNPKEYKAKAEKTSRLAQLKEEYAGLQQTIAAFESFKGDKIGTDQITASQMFLGVDLNPDNLQKSREELKKTGEAIAQLQKELGQTSGKKVHGGIITTGDDAKNDVDSFNKWLAGQLDALAKENLSREQQTMQSINDARTMYYEAQFALIDDEDLRERSLLQLKLANELADTKKSEEEKYFIRERYRLLSIGLDKKEERASEERTDKAKKEERKQFDEKVHNAELISDKSFKTISDLARASKASSAVQKGIDIAQATANTAIEVTKNLSTPWKIPFIIAMGTAQVALISQQKYAGGGVVGGGNPSQGDTVPALLTPGEMVLNGSQQASLWGMLSRPNVSNSSSVNLNINVGSGGTYDMNAARYTVDQLIPIIGDALVQAKSQGRLRDYEAAR